MIARSIAVALAVLVVATCGGEKDRTVCISGDVIPFNTRDRLEGAEIAVLEFPDMSMTTGADGRFEFCGLDVGTEVTLRLTHAYYHQIQTGSITLGEDGAELVTIQAVTNNDYDGLALVLGVMPDEENLCQMVTTVTRVGKSLYDPGDHGEGGATVTVDPVPVCEQGPVYFDEEVLPDASLTETSLDGGALFVNCEPGDYTWTAHKDGMEFTQIRTKCRAGWLVNASPPWGLQALP